MLKEIIFVLEYLPKVFKFNSNRNYQIKNAHVYMDSPSVARGLRYSPII